jgi:hypothetical protein
MAYLSIAAGILLLSSCKKFLKEDIYTQYDPTSFTSTSDGFEKVLNGAYSQLQVSSYANRNDVYCFSEFCADEMWETGGGFEASAKDFINFTWDATNSFFSASWSKSYLAVRDANVILDNKDNAGTVPADKLKGYIAEARFIRAAAYSYLYNFFGPVPLVTSAKKVDGLQTKASEEEMKQFIITELTAAAQDLPVTTALRGKATKGVALAVLCKFYLNKRMWTESAATAKQIIDLNTYHLFGDISRLFAVENESNQEYIYVFPCINQTGYGNIVMAHTFPPGYPIQTNWIIFGAQFKLYTKFVDSFDAADKRLKMILTHYTNTAGTYFEMSKDATGKALNNARSFKFVPDPNGLSADMGNDIPVIRYADILLSRAEALNELNGPADESIGLINEVRIRAGVDKILLTDYPSKIALRNFILEERGREFFGEGKRREDLIRMNVFISGAQARGMAAKDYHVLYPIPQTEIDADKNLVQNEGYK